MAANTRLGPPVGMSRFTQEWQDFVEWEWKSNIGEPEFGLSYAHTAYDGPDYVHAIKNNDPTDSNGIEWLNYDDSMHLRTNNSGMDWAGPWSFAGDGTITGDITHTGNTDQTGDYNLTGDYTQVGNADITGIVHVTGAVDFDSTLNVDGAVTLNAAVTLGNAVGDVITISGTTTANAPFTFTDDVTIGNAVGDDLLVESSSVFNGPVTMNGAVTLGNAAADVITFTGTASFAENLTFTKNLIGNGTAQRITADFTNSTVATRMLVQSSTVDGLTSLGVIPNGSATIGQVLIMNNSAPASGDFLSLSAFSTETRIVSNTFGGTALPLNIYHGVTKRFEIDATGIGFFATAPAAQQVAPALVSEGTADATYGNSERDSINEHSVAINELRAIVVNLGLAA